VCVCVSESSVDEAVTSSSHGEQLCVFERSPSPGIHTLLYADAKRHDHHTATTLLAANSTPDSVSTSTAHPAPLPAPAWMISPLSHAAAYPRHQSVAHFDHIVDSYSVAPYQHVDHLSMHYPAAARAHYVTDSLTGYVNGMSSDGCYFAPAYRAGLCDTGLDYGVTVLEPPVKKLCSGSVVIDSSPLHAMSPADYMSAPPTVNSSIIYAPLPPTFLPTAFSADADTGNMYSCRQMNVSPCVGVSRLLCSEPATASVLVTTSSADVVSNEMVAQ